MRSLSNSTANTITAGAVKQPVHPIVQSSDDVFSRLESKMLQKIADPDAMEIDGLEEEEGAEDSNAVQKRKHQWLKERATPITDSEKQRVKSCLQRGDDGVIIEKFNIPIRYKDLRTLSPGTWLNDEIVSFYMQLLQDRDKMLLAHYTSSNQKNCVSMLPSHYFNHFFMNRLLDNENNSYNYSNVARFTKRAKVNIFACSKVFIPINISNTHWTCCVIYITEKKIVYYDSMGGAGKRYVDAIMKYIQDEHKDKLNTPLSDIADWKSIYGTRNGCPQQQNGCDCGVFTLVCCDFLSNDLPLSYSQEDVTAIWRLKIANSICIGALPYSIL